MLSDHEKIIVSKLRKLHEVAGYYSFLDIKNKCFYPVKTLNLHKSAVEDFSDIAVGQHTYPQLSDSLKEGNLDFSMQVSLDGEKLSGFDRYKQKMVDQGWEVMSRLSSKGMDSSTTSKTKGNLSTDLGLTENQNVASEPGTKLDGVDWSILILSMAAVLGLLALVLGSLKRLNGNEFVGLLFFIIFLISLGVGGSKK